MKKYLPLLFSVILFLGTASWYPTYVPTIEDAEILHTIWVKIEAISAEPWWALKLIKIHEKLEALQIDNNTNTISTRVGNILLHVKTMLENYVLIVDELDFSSYSSIDWRCSEKKPTLWAFWLAECESTLCRAELEDCPIWTPRTPGTMSCLQPTWNCIKNTSMDSNKIYDEKQENPWCRMKLTNETSLCLWVVGKNKILEKIKICTETWWIFRWESWFNCICNSQMITQTTLKNEWWYIYHEGIGCFTEAKGCKLLWGEWSNGTPSEERWCKMDW